MAAVAARAGSSIGSLYTRVPDKAALVRAVHLRLLDRQLTALAALEAHHRPADTSLADVVDRFVGVAVLRLGAHAGLVRAIIVQGVRDPVMRERVSLALDEATRALARLLRGHAAELEHPDPDIAADTIVRALTGVLQQSILIDRPIDPSRLPAELRTLVLGYLGARAA